MSDEGIQFISVYGPLPYASRHCLYTICNLIRRQVHTFIIVPQTLTIASSHIGVKTYTEFAEVSPVQQYDGQLWCFLRTELLLFQLAVPQAISGSITLARACTCVCLPNPCEFPSSCK